MFDLAWLLLIAFGVGVLMGATSIGGILLIPAMAAFAGLPVQTAMSTALLTFAFAGMVGAIVFARRGSIDWAVTRPLLPGAVLCAFAGAWVNSLLQPVALVLVLAVLIVFSGVFALAVRHGMPRPVFDGQPRRQQWLLLAIGIATGFGSGLSGVGGPVLSVPLMMLCGFPVLAAIGASQVLMIAAAIAGTAGNLKFGSVDFGIAGMVAALEVAGVLLGVRIAHAANTGALRKFVALLCIAVGLMLVVREL